MHSMLGLKNGSGCVQARLHSLRVGLPVSDN